MAYRVEGAVCPVYILVEPATHFELCLQITSPISLSGAAKTKGIAFQCGAIDDRSVVTTLVSTDSQLTSHPMWEISPPTAVLSSPAADGWLKKPILARDVGPLSSTGPFWNCIQFLRRSCILRLEEGWNEAEQGLR